MRLSSVHELKAELLEDVTQGLPEAFGLMGSSARTRSNLRSVDVLTPDTLDLALGIGRGSRSGDYVLSARIQHAARGNEIADKVVRKTRGECDVRIVPNIEARSSVAFFRGRRRPLECGLSTGVLIPNLQHAGTLGCIFEVGDAAYALSNNHVLANVNKSDVGDPVVQPGTLDRAASQATLIGVLSKYVPISFQSANEVDAAIARILPDVEYYDRWSEAIGGQYQQVRTVTVHDLHRTVVKAGRTTGITRGKITAVALDQVRVNMGARRKPQIARFDNQFEVVSDNGRPFSLAGDSGSLILAKDGSPLGLLFAGGSDEQGVDLTYCNRLDRVMAELGVASL